MNTRPDHSIPKSDRASASCRVTLVAPNAWPLIDGTTGDFFGGLETQAWLIARGLAALPDLTVTLLVEHLRAPRSCRIDGVTVRCLENRLARLRRSVRGRVEMTRRFPFLNIRRFHPSLFWQIPTLALARAFLPPETRPNCADPLLQSVSSDLWIAFGVNPCSSRVIATAHAQGLPAILQLCSDQDLNPRFLSDPDYVDEYGVGSHVARFVLEHADVLLAQNERQQFLLRDKFARESIAFPNPIDMTPWESAVPASQIQGTSLPKGYVLWIGRADTWHKRPRLAVEVARQLPEVPFLMLLNPQVPEMEQEIRESAPVNVIIREGVPFSEMPGLMAGAALLLSTSSQEYEGLPNVFLQAAAAGTPVVSMTAGREFLEEMRCGVISGENIAQTVQAVRAAIADDRADREAIRRRLRERYDVASAAARLREVVLQTLSSVE